VVQTLAPPISTFKRDILCTGWNYWDHFDENKGRRDGQEVERPTAPTYFTKAPNAIIGPMDEIAWDERCSQKWDYEAELALVIGKAGAGDRADGGHRGDRIIPWTCHVRFDSVGCKLAGDIWHVGRDKRDCLAFWLDHFAQSTTVRSGIRPFRGHSCGGDVFGAPCCHQRIGQRLAGGVADHRRVAFALLLGLVLVRSRGALSPVFPVDLLERPVFALSICASVLAFTAQALGFILLPFYLIYGAGMAELQMAIIMSVWPAATAVLAPVLGRYANDIPAGATGAAGLFLMALGFVFIAQITDTTSMVDIALRFMMCGIGFAVFQTPNNRLLMLSAPKERSGAASGSLSIARQFGRATGTAIATFALWAGPPVSLDAMLIAAAITTLGALASFGRIWIKPK
jgi:hypothetical protein